MNKLVLKCPDNSTDLQKKAPHIMIVGQQKLQSLVREIIDNFSGIKNLILDTPNFQEVERCLGQIVPNIVIMTNFKLGLGLTLEKILAKVPADNVVVMCDELTLAQVIPTGVRVTTSKINFRHELLPIIQKVLGDQGY